MRTLHVGLRAGDLERSLAFYTALGYDVVGTADAPTSPDGSDDFWTAWLTDPDGYRIELVQWPSGHADGLTSADFAQQEPPEDARPGTVARSPETSAHSCGPRVLTFIKAYLSPW